MEFTPENAATMAQIIPILVLAIAFTPRLQGTLSTKHPQERDRPSATPHESNIPFGRAYIAICWITFYVFVFDVFFYLYDLTFSGGFAQIPVLANLGTVATLIGICMYNIHEHAKGAARSLAP